MPDSIHSHPLEKYPLSDNICSICSIKKTCQFGYKCKSCKLFICNECAKLICSNYNLNNIHEHDLILIGKKFFKCNKCKKRYIFYNIFYFYCEKCKIGICTKCYFDKN